MERIKSYKAYLFDLYGTLADIHTDEWKLPFWKSISKAFCSHGADYEAKELRTSYFSEVTRQKKEKREAGHEIEIDLREVFTELFRKKGISLKEEELHKTARLFRELSRTRLRPYAHTRELLLKLHEQGKEVYLLSNAQSIFTMEELRILKLDDLFDDILISSDCGYRKPDPIVFDILMKRNGLVPKDCLMIGNDLYSDILGANRAGVDSLYIRTALSSKTETEAKPDYLQEGMDMKRLMRKICEQDRKEA
ncbi:MAG: HAD family hydrolase [Erysipelotrichaceae bacterium]|nr:HAD family hydrolase [Erysipelotrichaceae bacterium]